MKVGIIGTVGIPAKYGGFETLVEQLVKNKYSEEIEYTVYCSSKAYEDRLPAIYGAKLSYIPFKANGLQSIPYDIFSLIKASLRNDALLVLGVSGCMVLPIFRLFSKKKLIVNIDGLEHKRKKWNKFAKFFLKFSEKMAVLFADTIICDNKGIVDYVKSEYHKDSELIAYGGDHVRLKEEISKEDQSLALATYGVDPEHYDLAICRIEPENNVEMILEAYSKMPDKDLIFIGNWKNSTFGRDLLLKYNNYTNIKMLDAIYDISLLWILRTNCVVYLHGHSAGGTNPSLVEAMFFAKPIFAYDCIYNRESTYNEASYFANSKDLILLRNGISKEVMLQNGRKMLEISAHNYKWEYISKRYETLY